LARSTLLCREFVFQRRGGAGDGGSSGCKRRRRRRRRKPVRPESPGERSQVTSGSASSRRSQQVSTRLQTSRPRSSVRGWTQMTRAPWNGWAEGGRGVGPSSIGSTYLCRGERATFLPSFPSSFIRAGSVMGRGEGPASGERGPFTSGRMRAERSARTYGREVTYDSARAHLPRRPDTRTRGQGRFSWPRDTSLREVRTSAMADVIDGLGRGEPRESAHELTCSTWATLLRVEMIFATRRKKAEANGDFLQSGPLFMSRGLGCPEGVGPVRGCRVEVGPADRN
jgi:hypothetical protein